MSEGALWLATSEQSQERQNQVINQLMQGRSNATGTVTLNSTGANTTTVTAPTCGPSSTILLMPQTSGAAAALATSFVASTNVTAGQFIVSHSTSTSTSRVFGWFAVG